VDPTDARADHIWREWEYRHRSLWAAYWRWGGLLVAISLVPYVKPDVLEPLGKAAMVFPVVTFGGTLLATILLGAEYSRVAAVSQELRRARGWWPQVRSHGLGRIFSVSIGWLAVSAFAVGLTLLSVGNALVLWLVLLD
jgi:hypothetical protein